MPYLGSAKPDPITRSLGFDVRPIKIGAWNHDLQTRVSRIIGYRFVCDCETIGPRVDTYGEARSLGQAHMIAAHR